MSFLNAVINKVKDEALREQLQERIAIIEHKIKFMDKVPVACLDTHNNLNYALTEVISCAGGILHDFVEYRQSGYLYGKRNHDAGADGHCSAAYWIKAGRLFNTTVFI